MSLLFIVFAGWINRVRGGGWPNAYLPFGPSIIPSFALGLVSGLIFWSWLIGIIAGLGYAFWAVWGFGDTSMGRSINPRAPWPWPIESLIKTVPGWPKEAVGMALRSLFAAPFFIACAVIGQSYAVLLLVPFALLVAGAYVVAFRLFWPGRLGIVPTVLAEVLTGLVWGGAILLGPA